MTVNDICKLLINDIMSLCHCLWQLNFHYKCQLMGLTVVSTKPWWSSLVTSLRELTSLFPPHKVNFQWPYQESHTTITRPSWPAIAVCFVRSIGKLKGILQTATIQILKCWADNAKHHDRPFQLFLAFCQTAGIYRICAAESLVTSYSSDHIANR